ncbi:unnamed protein product [Rotaria socialis]|uniref:HTH CENPB-type domain-containing protein n=2 Tax=Rotaria socialis TaxID=392032 RepID=A0A821RPC4_9BILA|nr:unnamed protein product [Rotaria socialis]
MTSIGNICKHLYEKALERSSVHSISTTEEEISIAINLVDLSEDLSNSDSFTIETEDSLKASDVDHFDLDYPVEIEDDEGQQVVENRQFSLEYMQRVVDFIRPGIAFTTVQHAFRRVTHPMQLERIREYVANNGSRRQKLERVEHFAKIENIHGFKASDYWLLNFKKRNGIPSRKVARFVSHRKVVDKSIIKQTVDDFLAEATKHIPKYKLDFVLNANQSSFNYEIGSNRTLSYAGEKATYLSIKSLNAISHSNTVMPTVSAAGQLNRPVFICLQEPTGQFPITRAIFSASNIVTSCSTSGKLNKS